MADFNGKDLQHNITNDTNSGFTTCVGPVEIAMYVVLVFLSLVGNLLIVAVFYRNKALRTPVHCFIVNMAISDLIIPVIFLPCRIADAYCDGVWLVEGVLGTIFCKFVQIAFSVSGSMSILSIVAIAFDRFYAIIFAIKPPLISQKICRRLVALTWIFSVTFVRIMIIYADLNIVLIG